MLSYGGVALQIAGDVEALFVANRIPVSEAFTFYRPRAFRDPIRNPRITFSWFLQQTIRLNTLTQPWGASRFGHVFVLADARMLAAIQAQNGAGQSLIFTMDDSLGGAVSTPMFQLPAVPLAKILGIAPQLPLWLMPLVDSRYRWWERAASITVDEGTTTWTDLFASIASALGTAIIVEPVASAYLKPGAGLASEYEYLPILLDICASSVGQRIVRRLNDSIASINPSTATALQLAQANANRKYAGGSLALLGGLDA